MFMTVTVGTADFGLSPLCKVNVGGVKSVRFVRALSSSGTVGAVALPKDWQ